MSGLKHTNVNIPSKQQRTLPHTLNLIYFTSHILLCFHARKCLSASICVCVRELVRKPRAVPSALRLYRPAVENRPVLGHVGQEVDRDIRMRAAVQNGITMCPEAAH